MRAPTSLGEGSTGVHVFKFLHRQTVRCLVATNGRHVRIEHFGVAQSFSAIREVPQHLKKE